MEIKINNKELTQLIGKFQEGGAVEQTPAPEQGGAPAPEQGGSPEEQILMACQQALESQDCNLAMQVCQAVLQMLGGGGQPEPQGEPVYRKGGQLKYFKRK